MNPWGVFPCLFCSRTNSLQVVSQGFAHWSEQNVPTDNKIVGIYNSRALPAALLQEARQHSVTQQDTLCVQDHLNVPPGANERLLMRASCGRAQCYKVVTCAHLRRCFNDKRDCLKCPAHQKCKTHSKWVLYMYDILQHEQVHSVIVHDWVDVPNSDLAHFDMTVFRHGRAFRFEIDGTSHEPRLISDVEKDRLVDEHVPQPEHEQCVSYARFHYRDYGQHEHGELWTASLHSYFAQPAANLKCVFYTVQYADLQQHNPAHVHGEGVPLWRFL